MNTQPYSPSLQVQVEFVKRFTRLLQDIGAGDSLARHLKINLMIMKKPLVTFLSIASSLQLLYSADITGKVTLKGTPKLEITIDMASDPKCGAMHSAPVTTRHYVTGADGGLANVLVYVKSGLADKNFPAPTDEPTLDQKGCEYWPYVVAIQTNQKLKIKNSDPTLHNVHAIPKPGTANKEFNFAQPVKDMVTEKSFPSPEVLIRFKCEVHPWMFAYVGVLDHPYFAVTDKDGNYKISGLPNGKYTIEAFHQKTQVTAPAVSQEVTVDGNKKVDFTIEVK